MSNGHFDPTTQPVLPPQHSGGLTPQQQPPSEGKAIASLVLGICSLFCWLCPIIGLPVSITGLVLGILANKRQPRTMTIAAIVMSVIGLILALGNAALGAYMGMTGQHPLFQP